MSKSADITGFEPVDVGTSKLTDAKPNNEKDHASKPLGVHASKMAVVAEDKLISPPLEGGEGFVDEQSESYKDRGGVNPSPEFLNSQGSLRNSILSALQTGSHDSQVHRLPLFRKG